MVFDMKSFVSNSAESSFRDVRSLGAFFHFLKVLRLYRALDLTLGLSDAILHERLVDSLLDILFDQLPLILRFPLCRLIPVDRQANDVISRFLAIRFGGSTSDTYQQQECKGHENNQGKPQERLLSNDL